MVFYCLSEPGYETSNWYKHIVTGLLNEKRSKRFTVILADSAEEIKNFPVNTEDVLLVIGSLWSWLDFVISECEKQFDNRIIVLGNCERKDGRKYSVVTSDVSRDVRLLYKYLENYGKKKIAMYGINPYSAADRFRKNSFVDCGGEIDDVFVNDGGLEVCFKSFLPEARNFDGVICANDYCAVSLIRHLKESGIELPFVVSCGETMLAKEFSPSITNLKTNYIEFGKAGIQAAKVLRKNHDVNSLSIYLSGEIVPGATTEFLPVAFEAESKSVVEEEYEDRFYEDAEVDEMLKIEKLLNQCEKNDLELIKLVLSGLTLPEIAEKLYMSTNGIKYKLKGMYELCGVNSKTDFLKMIEKYIK